MHLGASVRLYRAAKGPEYRSMMGLCLHDKLRESNTSQELHVQSLREKTEDLMFREQLTLSIIGV